MSKPQEDKINEGRFVDESECSYIKEHFSYNPNTGEITRDDRMNSNGSFDKDGYLVLKIKKRQYKAHRLAWFLFYGEFPKMEIDHINRNRADNRIANLRLSTRGANVANRTICPNKITGVVGVYEDRFTKGLKKRFATKYEKKTFRFYSLAEAINFRKEKGYAV